ncbi:RBP11-like subunits of RNA polymerase [Cryphonectria parasitica EP155]|uniref:RBP11-like subunits of RNA polymerase n=1 Tax=Cryphonectria parasitica (strain ATCC 38755 / EP155) TaxID=660469 RepID=A0A9P4YD67_CRYP1|nr:RBP11-like subunits of RNA polymerase [Cryphonectria parasitica EP155]KAF3770891.1 RBP11-like subunits of RNA polymerase [Cryphonectria parasitica EP155]
MNAPDRFELFLLSDGEKKISETPFPRMSNCSDFLIKKEDHTIGNLMSEHLKQHPHVLMAGYKIAHPNVPELFIRVQTDGTITPKDAFVEVARNLIAKFAQLGREFTREYELRRMATTGPTDGDGNANGGF